MLKIQQSVNADGLRLTLSGRIEAQHLAELQRLIDEAPPGQGIVLDLDEVRLVERDAVRFLLGCEATGIRLDRCPAYVREWIAREGKTSENRPRTKRR